MTNTKLLEQYIARSGRKKSYIARVLGLSGYGFMRKVRNESEFKTGEIMILCDLLGINTEDRERIFFADEVDCESTAIIYAPKEVRLRRTWRNMLARCYNPKTCGYSNYGGRGITVCDEWANDYGAFFDWAVDNGYQDHLSLDRIDVNGNYCPENCRWATWDVQARNKRPRRKIRD